MSGEKKGPAEILRKINAMMYEYISASGIRVYSDEERLEAGEIFDPRGGLPPLVAYGMRVAETFGDESTFSGIDLVPDRSALYGVSVRIGDVPGDKWLMIVLYLRCAISEAARLGDGQNADLTDLVTRAPQGDDEIVFEHAVIRRFRGAES